MPTAVHPIVRKLSLGVAFLLALLFGAQCALAQEIAFPRLSGRVVDDANLLDAAARADLEAKLAALEAKTSDQLVVVTVRSLGGRSIEEYGYRLGRSWAIGQKDKNNGVLLIVAPHERKVRVEVGYGLEGALPDAIANVIIQNTILPRFKANDYPGGIARGVDDLIKVLSGDAEEFKRQAPPKKNDVPSTLFGIIGVLAPFLFSGPGLILLVISLHLLFGLFLHLGMWLNLIPQQRKGTHGSWLDSSRGSYSSGSWSSSGSDSGGFSGGGGSFGGGGSSGSW
jgi:uncharacterized protein